jgi:putative copper export protein
VIVRILSFTALAWLLGFAWFAILLPQPLDGRRSDAIVVLTGGAGESIAAWRCCARGRRDGC